MQNCQKKHQHNEEQQLKKCGCEELSVGAPNSNSNSTKNPSHLEGTSSKEPQPEKVTVKVKLEEVFIKFEICLKCGVNKIFEEVVTMFNLWFGTFKIKYKDENNDDILIINDDDLQLSPKYNIRINFIVGMIPISTSNYATCNKLFVSLD